MSDRLQKIIAESGLMSRRAAEEAIRNGRVVHNGRTASLGEKAEPEDRILVDGDPLPRREQKRYYMLNKPRGYVCSMHDERGRRSVRELLPSDAGRVYPVGRLDIQSEGLLLMTNDGEFALRVSHPSGELLKTYRTSIRGDRLAEGLQRMKEPFFLDGSSVQAVQITVRQSDECSAVVDITVREGKNRQIRRMCEQAGLTVLRLVRIAEGSLHLDRLPSGQFRELTKKEINSVLSEARK